MNDLVKVKLNHAQRTAFVYIRQSSPAQVEYNRESTARQYALLEKAQELGWAKEQVIVIDEDLGLSGSVRSSRCRDSVDCITVTHEQPELTFAKKTGLCDRPYLSAANSFVRFASSALKTTRSPWPEAMRRNALRPISYLLGVLGAKPKLLSLNFGDAVCPKKG